jgi:serine/threonine protein kinase
LGSPEYPDLTTFPFLKKVEVSSVHQSYEIAAIWKDSMILDYGSHASIRITEHHRFPSSPIQHEFDILIELAKLGLPVVEIDQQPVLDNGIACGYRMKKPSKLEPSELQSRADDIKQTLDRLHSAGFSHGDFSPSNIMMDEGGHLILIDFSFAGRVGRAVPSFLPSWVYTDGIYGIGSDIERFDRYTVPI